VRLFAVFQPKSNDFTEVKTEIIGTQKSKMQQNLITALAIYPMGVYTGYNSEQEVCE
jgi:hypothetical protein